MPHLRIVAALFFALGGCLPAQSPESPTPPSPAADESASVRPRLGPPKSLLTAPFQWQAQSGQWKADGESGAVSGRSDGTIAEYSTASGLALGGHWLAVRVTLAAHSKAGVRLAGVRDARGDVLRLSLDSTSSEVLGDRGQRLAGLPAGAFAKPVELILNFGTDHVSLHYAGQQLGEFAVTFEEPQATPSLLVERGQATFAEMLLSGEPAAEPPLAAKPAPGARVALNNLLRRINPLADAPPGIPTFDFTPEAMTPLKSGWNDYFGVHIETGPGPWKMVRQYDGPSFSTPAQNRHVGDVKQFPGPFAEVPVDLSLGDFRDWKRKEARGLDENLTALVREDRQALYIAPWNGPVDKHEKDRIYALMKMTYGAIPAAEGRLFFQWGDGLNESRYGSPQNPRKFVSEPTGAPRPLRNANLPENLTVCAEDYLAPAIEAVRRASQEIYHDPRRIPIVAGSCSVAGQEANRAWYGRLLDRPLDGTSAPSLKGRRLASVVDYLAVNYPFTGADNDAALQELWDRFCAPPPGEAAPAPAEGAARPDDNQTRPRGLWVTEEYGAAAKGTGSLLNRAGRFLAWAARNRLDAQQTRLLWYISPLQRGRDDTLAALRTIGESFGPGPLRIASQEFAESRYLRITGNNGRMLLIHLPDPTRRARNSRPIGDIKLTLPEALAEKPWIARLYQDLGRQPVDAGAFDVRRDGTALIVNIGANAREPWALLVENP